MAWRNGNIPEGDLVIFERGYNDTDRNWYWGLTPGTYARVLALIALAFLHTGRRLSPGDGWSTYRPLWAQEIARRIHGIFAATPGASSHGGFWEGRETLAIDFSNWSWVYGGDRAAFYADCWAVGLTPGMIEPRRGYPDEPWHVIDMNPRAGAPAPAGTITPSEEDELMAAKDEIIASITKLQAEIHDRRDVVVARVVDENGVRTTWVLDHGAGTKRNAYTGLSSDAEVNAYVDWLNAQGIPTLGGDQAPFTIAGYRDITDGK
ncbi:hypothetical protein [Microbacterium sp. CFBP 8794]|uniref:hypothetical protein n=1 Tax=Microbacterium sp. CFBP 8794 TaxID=2775269 RepID=UPI00177BBE4A|nr:hypothetical protein [Microbacterium sp. CFBP 8794]MBD8477558.1 hypothetical protein [Microbacterium sp. CFBP 8794]